MDDSTKARLIMDGGRADGLEVRRLTLKEGVCRIPTAEVVLWSDARAIKMDALADYVERPAALEISRSDVDPSETRRTTRWFSGIVTSVEGCGVVAHSRDGNVFEYHMTIQPRLVNLCYSRSGHNFCKVKALDAVREILKGVDNVMYDTDGLPASAQIEQDFFQFRESDYGFLMRVLASCGLCYTFKTPAQGAGGAVRMPEMYVGPGKNMPAASAFLVDGRAVGTIPSDFSCSAIRTDGRFCRMDSWRMRKSIGVDSLDVGYTNRSGADVRGSAGKGDVRHVKMYEGLSADAKQSEIDRLAEESLTRLRLSTMGWTGSTQCLEAMPGQNLKVSHFYGEDEDDVIAALVVASTMDCTLPVLIGKVNLDDGAKVSLNIAIRCLSDSDDAVSGAQSKISAVGGGLLLGATPDNTLQPSSNLGEIPTANGGGGGGVLGGGGGGGGGLTLPCVTQATVVGAAGSTGTANGAVKFVSTGTDDDPRYVFKALPDGSDPKDVVEVYFTQAVGGYGQGLFRMPRIGDRVVLFGQPQASGSGFVYYLLAYLPSKTMPFTTQKELERATKTGGSPEVALPEEMLSLRFQTSGSVPDDTALNNDMGIRRTKQANACSEIAFYNTHDGRKWNDKGEDVKETFDSKVPAGRKVLANFQSTGNMQLSANDNVDITAKNFTFKCPERAGWRKESGSWKISEGRVSFDDINKFVVEAKKEIVFKVGHNKIAINQNGIAIRSIKWNEAGGPMDSYIYMDAISGVSIGGMSCSMSGFFGASMRDSIGGGVATYAGTASLSGTMITQKTIRMTDFVLNTVFAGADLAAEIAAFGAHNSTTGQDAIYGVQSALHCAQEITATAREIKHTVEKEDTNAWNVIVLVLSMVCSLIDLVRLEIDAANPDLLSQPASGQSEDAAKGKDYVTVRDALRLTMLCLKGVIWIDALAECTATAFKDGVSGVAGSSSVTLRRGKFESKSWKWEAAETIEGRYKSTGLGLSATS